MSIPQNKMKPIIEQSQANNQPITVTELLHSILDRLHTSENRVSTLKAQNKQLTADLHDEVLSRIHWEKRFKELKKQSGQ